VYRALVRILRLDRHSVEKTLFEIELSHEGMPVGCQVEPLLRSVLHHIRIPAFSHPSDLHLLANRRSTATT
jgi:hypothetical protein